MLAFAFTFDATVLIAILLIFVIICLQFLSWSETRTNIKLLEKFFPQKKTLSIINTCISMEVLNDDDSLKRFISNPPARTISQDGNEDDVDSLDLELIKCKDGSEGFKEVVFETNSFLCKNIGISADLPAIQDICERKIESVSAQISNSINLPLYLGLAGTFIGIISGLFGVSNNIEDLFDMESMDSLSHLLMGVVFAMIVSLLGLSLMIFNVHAYKKALKECDANKNQYYDFIRVRLMPSLSISMAASLNSLKSVLGKFVGKFGTNLDKYMKSFDLLNNNISEERMLLKEINELKLTETSQVIADTFVTLKNSSDSLNKFYNYQESLCATIEKMNNAALQIQGVISSFNGFTMSLNELVKRQSVANDLQEQFKSSLETHFPTGSDAVKMWRTQLDNITSDAKVVSNELHTQLKAQTDYISTFVNANKEIFTSMSRMDEVLKTLVSYSDVQAKCYTDLKSEISTMRTEQVNSQKFYAQLNENLLLSVKEMIEVLKDIKN